MQTILRQPRHAGRCKVSTHSCRKNYFAGLTTLFIAKNPATSLRDVQAYGFFDGLKKILSGSDNSSKPQISSQDIDLEGAEEAEGADMKRLDSESGGLAEDQSVFGPLAVLLVGFMAEEVEQFRTTMLEIEADMVKIVPCSPSMMGGTLQQALESEFPKYEQVQLHAPTRPSCVLPLVPNPLYWTDAWCINVRFTYSVIATPASRTYNDAAVILTFRLKRVYLHLQPLLGTRRTVFLSGMVGAEVVEVIAAYKEAGMPPTVWAAAVPNNYTRLVKDLVDEVHADNTAMVRRAQEAQARQAAQQEVEMGDRQL
ncbi:hypothetical protein VaNZ11_006859 [Volvox africanus]|uniref:Uncharacterized protein n=1 Tax=Volvox africanus TaxID=51714 RepID=A0ABQ5S2V8_9CHLO|nr:hypothetical protein VaNZ11_006859 [Volvox africanus]